MTSDGRRTGMRHGAVLLALLGLFLLLPATRAAAADCGCTTVGPYKDPVVKQLAVVNSDGTSPDGRYKLTATGSGSAPQVTIKRVSDNTTVFSQTLPSGSQWGFGPNGDAFVYHYLYGNVHNVVLSDLSKTSSNKQVWTDAVTTGSSRIFFSPNGKYMAYGYLFGGGAGATTTNIHIVDTHTGSEVGSTAFATMSAPGGQESSFGVASWGFAPGDSPAFVFGYVNGQNSVSLNLLNLSTHTNVLSTNLTGPSAYWQFSACGDVLGVVQQIGQNTMQAATFRASNGQSLGNSGAIPLANATLNSTLQQHQLTLTASGENVALGSNTADDACATAAALQGLTLTPTSVTGGSQSSTGTITLDHAPSSSITVTLSSDDTSAATVPASVAMTGASKTFTVTSKSVTTTKTVTIKATYNGVSKTATLTVNPPNAPLALADLSLSPSSVQGGNSSTGTVTLNQPAPSGGTHVGLASDNAAATVPTSVLVAAGNSTATFTVATNAVLNDTTAGVKATLGSNTITRTLGITAAPVTANAVNRDSACLTNTLPANDDGSTGVITLPFTANFFGTEYDQLWLNNNGNVTFDSPLSTYTPFNLTSTNRTIIAPFFADVDTRGAGSGLVTWGTTTVNGRQAECFNWTGVDYGGVGYYSASTDKLNTFQLILIDRSDTGAGNFDIQFNYDKIQWETGSASGGSGGLGGSSARAGYSNGDPLNPQASFELPGSAVNGALLDSSPTGLTRNSRNSSVNGRYVFEVRNGAPPTGGQVHGQVLGPNDQPISGSTVQLCRADNTCVRGRSNSQGNYTVAGLDNGEYTATAFPPAGSSLTQGTLGPLEITSPADVLNGQDIHLTGPTPLPPNTTISPSSTNGQGIPNVYWHDPLTLTTQGCPGGTATYDVTLENGTSASSGNLTEGPAGTYTVTIPPLAPNHGNAHVHIAIDCPDGTPDQSKDFDMYIDPSGTVRTVDGDPIANATVTLYQSDSPDGPFTAVPDGSDVMSSNNRNNPDVTDDAGHFGWDVVAGYYKVRASADGCVNPDDPSKDYVETDVLTVPPPVTNLDLRLDCPEPNQDTTAPTITLTSPLAATYARNQAVNAHYTCADADSGIASCHGPVNDGDAIDTSTLGEHTFTVHATDNSGNPAEQSVTYTVVDALPGRMTAKGSFGSLAFAAVTNCTTGASGNAIQAQGGGRTFVLTSVDQVACYRDAGASYVPAVGFTTQAGVGHGKWNGQPGYTIVWTLLDGGDGTNDRVSMVVRSSSGDKVLDVSGAPGPFPGATQPTGLVTATR